MFDHPRTGDRALLRDVANNKNRYLILFRELHEAADALAQLCDRTRSRGQLVACHCLNRIDNQDLGAALRCLCKHIVQRRVGEQLQLGRCNTKPLRTLSDLAQRFLAGRVQHPQVTGQLCGNLLQQRRLSDARIASEQDHGARHEPATKHPVEFGESGGLPVAHVIR